MFMLSGNFNDIEQKEIIDFDCMEWQWKIAVVNKFLFFIVLN